MNAIGAVLIRDLRTAWRGGGAGVPLAFFLLIAALLPFGVGANRDILQEISAGSIWISALLACLLSLDRLFRADIEDGSLDLFRASPVPLEGIVMAKCLAVWLSTGLPLTLASPILCILHGTEPDTWYPVAISLLVGTPTLTLLGALGAATAAGLRASGLLAPLLVLPLTVPALIFGAAAASGLSDTALLAGLGLTVASVVLAPVAAAAMLRQAVT